MMFQMRRPQPLGEHFNNNIMVPALCWWNLPGLCLLLGYPVYGWMPRTFPCDVINGSIIVVECYNRGLKEVPTGITENANVISLAENKIRQLSLNAFENLENLTELDLNWANQNNGMTIENGTFSKLKSLRILGLSGNSLHNVPESLPRGLNVLRLENNKITSLSPNIFLEFSNITQIYLSRNCYYWNPCGNEYDVGNKSFSGLTNLRILTLGFNNLTHVPKGLPPSLENLVLSSNQIQRFTEEDFKELTNLRVLILQENCPRCFNAPYPCVPCLNVSLEIHPLAFSRLKKLEVLNLAGNSLRVINSSWFESFTKLKFLYLSFNFLLKAIAEGGFMNNLSFLENIDLSFNYGLKVYPLTLNLSSDFSKLESLQTLHIKGYVFKEICNYSLSPLSGLKKLSVLDLGTNFIVHANPAVFEMFSKVKLIYLSENKLYPITGNSNGDQCKTPSENLGMGNSLNSVTYTPSFRENEDFQGDSLNVKPECLLTGRVLDLSSNNLFFISSVQFYGFGDISCLNLSKNGFAAALNGTEFSFVSGLKYLDLSYNKIDLAYDNAFSELKNLTVLDLSYNPHYFELAKVTHNLNFLENLPSLKVLNMSYNNINTLTSKTMNSSSLNELQFHHNKLGILWKEKDHTYVHLFSYLVNLTYLDISHNYIDKIPRAVFKNLSKNLTRLSLGYNSIIDFEWDVLSYIPHLTFLDLSHNDILEVSRNLSQCTNKLQLLDLRHNKIAQLSDGFLSGAKSIHTLDLRNNQLSVINRSTFESRSDNYLETLYLGGNPFRCTCDILEFILWINNNHVTIPRLVTSVTCSTPAQRQGNSVAKFDIKECIDAKAAFLFHFFSALFIICLMVTATAMHLFYWDASYILHYWRAKVKGYHRLESADNVYNAFITYDTKNPLVSEWVLNHLRIELEEDGDKIYPICLEERDWTPGIPVIDNLTHSIRQSRKTVFVLTEAYVQSGTFKMAIYLAHQRLLDDNDDVIVLLLLEPVLHHSHFLRLRRRLCSRSVLEWPQNPSAEQWFWQCLRTSVRVDNKAMYSKQYSHYFASK